MSSMRWRDGKEGNGRRGNERESIYLLKATVVLKTEARLISVLPEPPKITTSLAERIAKLNANVSTEKTGTGNSSSTLPGEIKSKISRYEATGQHEAPLVPKGSFGLGAPLAAPTRGLDRIRIASSGVSGGQAPISLVPPHSAGPTDRRCFSSSQQAHRPFTDNITSPPPNAYARHSLGAQLSNSLDLPTTLCPPLTPSAMSTQAQPASQPGSPLDTPLPTTPMPPHTPSGSFDHEEARVEKTRVALERFEAEETDPVARPSSSLLGSLVSSAAAFLEPREEEEDGRADGSTDSPEAYDGILDAYPASSSVEGSMNGDEAELPMVKCSDCGTPLSLSILAEHVCGPLKKTEPEPVSVNEPEPEPESRPVPADVPIDAHETSSNASDLDLHPVNVEALSESDLDDVPDLPEEVEVSDLEEEVETKTEPVSAHAISHIRSPPTLSPVQSVRAVSSPAHSPVQSISAGRPTPSLSPVRSIAVPTSSTLSPAQKSPRNFPSNPNSTRNSWYDDDDEDEGCQTGFVTIVRSSRT
ncbi:hypothetical protein CROQUDRAFT_133912 [Cronartium quercuum f. sp. fusiforme G11]|uniref:Uncharacterized protein n=1 Tax=Cronartium quercuum f. sp. fusiforme G11 TaxID=708437 RepID=A0A9P6NFQ4_9BASI|nr:hypothetical protein CROQUDRAFT_133912 [Cronartium quercuum f. sp. fusiforme G11]